MLNVRKQQPKDAEDWLVTTKATIPAEAGFITIDEDKVVKNFPITREITFEELAQKLDEIESLKKEIDCIVKDIHSIGLKVDKMDNTLHWVCNKIAWKVLP